MSDAANAYTNEKEVDNVNKERRKKAVIAQMPQKLSRRLPLISQPNK